MCLGRLVVSRPNPKTVRERLSWLATTIPGGGDCLRDGLLRGGAGIGNIDTANRDKTYPDLGAGQHIVADNVFEGGVSYRGRLGAHALISMRGSTLLIVRNNLFINFNSPGVWASGWSDTTDYPAANTTIVGNIFDLTAVGQKPIRRVAVDVSSNDAIVADN